MQQRLPPLLDRPITFAHRGARAHAPENTLAAFELGLRLGATGLESDVWVTKDGVCVLDHDGVVRNGLRKRAVGQVHRGDLPGHIPTLAELLRRCPGQWHLSLDLKDPESGAATVGVVRSEAPGAIERLWLCHPDVETLAALRTVAPGAKLVHSTRLKTMTAGAERHAMTLAERGIDVVNLHHAEWTGGLATLFHRFGIACFAWDLQIDHQLHTLLRMGMDGIYSDWVDRMLDAYRREYPD